MHRIAVRIVEAFEQADELVLFAFRHAKIVDVQIIALGGERFLRHDASPCRCGRRAAVGLAKSEPNCKPNAIGYAEKVQLQAWRGRSRWRGTRRQNSTTCAIARRSASRLRTLRLHCSGSAMKSAPRAGRARTSSPCWPTVTSRRR